MARGRIPGLVKPENVAKSFVAADKERRRRLTEALSGVLSQWAPDESEKDVTAVIGSSPLDRGVALELLSGAGWIVNSGPEHVIVLRPAVEQRKKRRGPTATAGSGGRTRRAGRDPSVAAAG